MEQIQTPSVFAYLHAGDYLRAVYRFRKSRNKNYSLRLWTRQLGLNFSDSGNLSRILSGDRPVSAALMGKFIENLDLEGSERAYFEILCMGASRLSIESLSMIRARLFAGTRPMEIEEPQAPRSFPSKKSDIFEEPHAGDLD